MEAFPIFSGAESQVGSRSFSVAPGLGSLYEFAPDRQSRGFGLM
jgi:hypothetical protein